MSLPPVTERELQSQVLELAALYGWRTFHTWISIRSAPGLPDLLCVRPPRVLFAELKGERGKVTPAQQQWLDALGACPGVETYTWRPADLEEIARILT